MITVISGSYASEKETIIEFHNKCYALLDTNLDSAILLANKAELLAKHEEDSYLQAQSLFIKAYAYRMKDDQGKSFISNLKALDLVTNLTSEKEIKLHLELLINTSEILMNHFAYLEAIQYLEKGIELAKQYNIQNRLLLLLYNKGISLKSNGNLEEALDTFNETLTLAYELNDELRILRSLNQKGLTLKDLKSYKSARTTYHEMINFQHSEKYENKYKGQAWHNIAGTYVGENDFERAKNAYLNALSYKMKRNKSEELFITYQDLAETLLKMNQIEEANHYAQLCLPLYSESSLDPDNYKFFNLMSEIAHQRNDSEGVRKYAKLYFEENEKFLNQQREILEVKDRYKMEVLTAGFFSELHADQNISILEKVLWSIAIFFTTILFLTRAYSYIRKRTLSIQINQIKDEGSV